MTRLLPLAVAIATSLAAVGQTTAPAAADKDAFLAGITGAFVESDLGAGADSERAYAAVRRYVADARFVAAYDAKVAERFGKACAALRLSEGLDAVLAEADPATAAGKRVPLYLGMVQSNCPKRLQEERVLLGEVWAAIEKARSLRAKRYAAYLEEGKQLAARREEERAELERLAEARRREAQERERAERARLAVAEAARAVESAKAAEDARAAPAPGAATLQGIYRCGDTDESRLLYLGDGGEALDLVMFGGRSLGYAGLYRVDGDRVVIRFVTDNMWKIFAQGYERPIADDFAWKRSAIASQRVMEFRAVPAGDFLRIERPRVKQLRSGVVSEPRREPCKRLDPGSPTAKGVVAHARLAMRYVDREVDEVPASLDGASLALAREIDFKKRKELEWFQRAPGVVKMMIADRLLEELRKSADNRCLTAKAGFERSASVAMSSINQISDSELARDNPVRAEEVAGRQLDGPFEEFLDLASKAQCIMDEASAAGL